MNSLTHEADLIEDINQVKHELEFMLNERERVLYLTKNPMEIVVTDLDERIQIFQQDLESLENELFELTVEQAGC